MSEPIGIRAEKCLGNIRLLMLVFTRAVLQDYRHIFTEGLVLLWNKNLSHDLTWELFGGSSLE